MQRSSRRDLFGRLSQAQESSPQPQVFQPTMLCSNRLRRGSCLGLYDIGNLEFVYVTRIDRQQIEENFAVANTGNKFDSAPRRALDFTCGKTCGFFATAAFAAVNGWLILGTREDLVAGVLDRIAGTAAHSLRMKVGMPEQSAGSKGEADGARGDLQHGLEFEQIVPSPLFRTYWIKTTLLR